MKRTLDVVVAMLVLVLTLPVWLVAAALIRLTSPGSVFYLGRRIGKDGQPFDMYKFRSMRMSDEVESGITAADNPRITSVGRLLRATKIDELPQLLNVLRGEMSLVGPRPEAPEYVALYDDRQREVLSVRPGITGPTQLLYRREEQLLSHADVDQHYRTHLMPRKLETDLAYVYNHSFWHDIEFLARTLVRLVRW
jgi:lipopolysaccharide/colanic/teichoic acid biosynthesis glycosyltransferase